MCLRAVPKFGGIEPLALSIRDRFPSFHLIHRLAFASLNPPPPFPPKKYHARCTKALTQTCSLLVDGGSPIRLVILLDTSRSIRPELFPNSKRAIPSISRQRRLRPAV
ncbi:hypothetical protein LY78DRAFT_446547 [Colletotrichum sublineola]|nr:hypothetical protein LY78DRAFT_446547 [Colletotrichum sublineola]